MTNDFTLLNYLKAVMASGSITAASKTLYISQPYLSKYIKDAEEELGVQLLDRNQRPIALTKSGAKYLQGLEDIDNEYNTLINDVREMTLNKTDSIRLGINQSISSKLVPIILNQYTDKYPNDHISIKELPSINLENMLLNKEIDMHIRMLPIFPNIIHYQPLVTEPVYLIINRSCPLFSENNKRIISFAGSLKQLNNCDFITLHAGSGFMRLIELFLNSNKLHIKKKFEIKSIDTASNMALSGLGCTFIPSFFVNNNFDSTKCNIFKMPIDVLKVNIVISYLKEEALSQSMRNFINTVDLKII
ncbi:LysR family transcriptional regulator [Lentilactobacillus senioris]|uniref:LysR family transcriptional regulator n=1 Tax=Lentilactobacillus senioris TaxID=931534 RepID=UPI00227EDB62|nr:LysR family transcriptional regulator [Lentilactobacillus senioris]MCY9806370.1 LysR family transcriptional regulator [Lentilactobacillus senioris]